MSVVIDISVFLSYLSSTSNLALSCRDLYRKVISNGFPIRTSKDDLCLDNLSFYKLLDYPEVDEWLNYEIFMAIAVNDPEYLCLVVDQGADLETRDEWGDTALIDAVIVNRPGCLKILLERGANTEAGTYCGQTPLMKAAYLGKVDCLQLLLQHKASLETKSSNGYTALMWAASRNKTNCLHLLVQAEAIVSPEVRGKYPQYAHLWGDSTL